MTRIRRSILEHHPPHTGQFTGRIKATSAQTGGCLTPSAAGDPVAITEALSSYLRRRRNRPQVWRRPAGTSPRRTTADRRLWARRLRVQVTSSSNAGDHSRTTSAPDRAGNRGESRRDRRGSPQAIKSGQRTNGPQMHAASQAESSGIVVVTGRECECRFSTRVGSNRA